jgi:hypothetical protein
MNTTTLFRKLSEKGYVYNSALTWNRIDLSCALEAAGFDTFEIAAISDLDKDILLNDFFDKVEDYLTETITELMIDHLTSMKDNKEPINVADLEF